MEEKDNQMRMQAQATARTLLFLARRLHGLSGARSINRRASSLFSGKMISHRVILVEIA
jgi:hypothetical protein